MDQILDPRRDGPVSGVTRVRVPNIKISFTGETFRYAEVRGTCSTTVQNLVSVGSPRGLPVPDVRVHGLGWVHGPEPRAAGRRDGTGHVSE